MSLTCTTIQLNFAPRITNQKTLTVSIMKKKILLGAFLSIFICSVSVAAGKNTGISERIKASFQEEFAKAEDVRWKDCDQYVKASFKLEDQELSAYFNPEGDLLAITRNIISDQLPIHLLTVLRKEYAGCWITDLFELYVNDETIYYVTIQDENREKVLKSSGGDWELYHSKRK
jgi:hypothetical protein